MQYTTVIYPINFKHKDLTLDEIYQAISDYLKIEDYKQKSRKRRMSYARHLFCYMSRMYTSAYWKDIADHVGGRDHTTAIHSVQTLKDWHETDDNVREDVRNIKLIINNGRNYETTGRNITNSRLPVY